jgi:hypothetical protein
LNHSSISFTASFELKSRWFVGSSITTISGCASSIFAKATLDLSHQDSNQIFWSAFSWSMRNAQRYAIISL